MHFFKKLIFKEEKREALLALTSSSIIWGVSTPIMKLLLLIAPTFLVAFLRFFLAAFVILFTRPSLKIKTQDIPRFLFAGIFGLAIHISFFFFGIELTSVINASVILAATPVLTLIFANALLREKISRNMFIGCLLGIVGFLIVFLAPILREGISKSLLGNTFLLVSTGAWVLYEIQCKKLGKKYSVGTIAFYTFLIGGIVFLPFALPSFNLLPQLIHTPLFIFAIIWGIFITSSLAFYLWQWGLSKLTVSRVGFFIYLDPIISTAAAILILNEKIKAEFLIGAAFIFFGLYVAETTIHFPHFHLSRKR